MKEHRRDRVLTDSELAQLWRSLPPSAFGDIVRLLILTGQRRHEIADLRWSEVDLDRGLIRLPASRTKNKHPHEIPLAATAKAILEARLSESNGEAVFGHFTAWSGAKASLDGRCAIPAYTLHDLRRTCATGLGNLRVPPHVIETVLNHRGGHRAGVAGTYNHSAYPEEVREALEKWAAHVAEIVAVPTGRPVEGNGEGLAKAAAVA